MMNAGSDTRSVQIGKLLSSRGELFCMNGALCPAKRGYRQEVALPMEGKGTKLQAEGKSGLRQFHEAEASDAEKDMG
jgi:hypothetical protein